jgi:hypothetical protein
MASNASKVMAAVKREAEAVMATPSQCAATAANLLVKAEGEARLGRHVIAEATRLRAACWQILAG